jgi:hypothetical protein
MAVSGSTRFGPYGLRERPTLLELLNDPARSVPIPIPDRRDKWYANGPYRAFILNASQKYHEYERAVLDYASSGAELPVDAAMVGGDDAAGRLRAAVDESFERYRTEQDARTEQEAIEIARAAVEESRRKENRAKRERHLRALHRPKIMFPVIQVEHEALEEAGVMHHYPEPGEDFADDTYDEPVEMPLAAGIYPVVTFKSFEELNGLQPPLKSKLTPAQSKRIEAVRDFAPHTWSS